MVFLPVLFPIYPLYYRKILTDKVPKGLIIFLLIIGLFMLPIITPIAKAYKEATVTVDNSEIRVGGVHIQLDELNKVFLADTLPRITLRTNGLAIGAIRKGYFRAPDLQQNVRLVFHSNNAPYLYIIYGDNDKHVILNFRNREKTREVYEKLKELTGE
jgi:hypothetical protein